MQTTPYQWFMGSCPARAASLLAALLLAPGTAWAQDLAEARRLYNLGRYEEAESTAKLAAQVPAFRHPALVVLGRAGLERFRQTADPADLDRARAALKDADASRLEPRDRVELLIGLSEALYLDDLFVPAAELLESALGEGALLGPAARDQLLDWWATSLDRHAQTRAASERGAVYDRISDRMALELARDPGLSAAPYWMAVAARSKGDVDRAWDLARAGWVRAQLTRDRGAALRPDLDRLVREAIIPERVRRQQALGGDVQRATAGSIAEWETFTSKWTK